MNNLRIALTIVVIIFTYACKNRPQTQIQNQDKNEVIQSSDSDTLRDIDGVFDIPELHVISSPDNNCQFSFPMNEKVVDYDVSLAGKIVAIITEVESKSQIKFWELGQVEISEICQFPEGFIGKSIVWLQIPV